MKKRLNKLISNIKYIIYIDMNGNLYDNEGFGYLRLKSIVDKKNKQKT